MLVVWPHVFGILANNKCNSNTLTHPICSPIIGDGTARIDDRNFTTIQTSYRTWNIDWIEISTNRCCNVSFTHWFALQSDNHPRQSPMTAKKYPLRVLPYVWYILWNSTFYQLGCKYQDNNDKENYYFFYPFLVSNCGSWGWGEDCRRIQD